MSSDSFAMQNSCLAARKLNNKGEDMMAVAASTAGDSYPTSQKHRSRLSFRRKEPPQIWTIPNSDSRRIWKHCSRLEGGAFLHDLVRMALPPRFLISKLRNLEKGWEYSLDLLAVIDLNLLVKRVETATFLHLFSVSGRARMEVWPSFGLGTRSSSGVFWVQNIIIYYLARRTEFLAHLMVIVHLTVAKQNVFANSFAEKTPPIQHQKLFLLRLCSL